MRTTLTLEPEVDRLVRRVMRERGLTFKEAVNDAIRRGIGGGARGSGVPVDFPAYDLGEPVVDVTKALRLAGELEDEELVRRVARGT